MAQRAQPLADHILHLRAAPCIQQQAVAIAPAQQGHRGGRGAKDLHIGQNGARGADTVCRLARFGIVLARYDDRGPASKGRRVRIAAGLGFGGIEGIAIARGQGGDDGSFRVARLDQHFARLRPAPRTTRHLRHLLIGPLCRAQIAAFQPQIGIDHAYQRQFGKVEALGDKLRSHDHIDCAAFRHGDELCRLVGRIDRVGCDHGDTRIGQDFGHLVRDSLHAGAAGDEAIAFAAFGAYVGRGSFHPTMVASQPCGEAVFHQPGAAIGAFEAVAAVPAQGERGIAAPVEEQQRLLVLGQPVLQRLHQRRGKPVLARGLFLGEINRGDGGHLRPAKPGIEHQPRVNPLIRHRQAFQRRGSAGEHHGQAFEPGAHDRHIARVITHPVILLEADLVRFIHHDQAQIGIGQEQGGAGTHHHLCLTAGNCPPGSPPFRAFERGMPQHRGGTETPLKALEESLGQRDFGQKNQNLPSHFQSSRDGLEIGFGLARPGHAIKQEGLELPCPDSLRQPRRDFGLLRIQCRRGKGRVGAGVGAVAIHLHRFEHALVDEAAQHGFGNPGYSRKFADRRLFALQRLHRRLPLRSEPFGQPARQAVFGNCGRATQRAAAGDYHARHRGERRAVIIRRPFDQPHQFGLERRHRHLPQQRSQLGIGHRIGWQAFRLPDNAQHLPRPQRGDYDRAGAHFHAIGHAVIQRAQRGIEDQQTNTVHGKASYERRCGWAARMGKEKRR